MNVSVVGLGYVGLPLALKLSLLKYEVTAIDKNLQKIAKLKTGVLPFAKEEPDFRQYFEKSKKLKNIHFTTEYSTIGESEIIFVCVDTPTTPNKKPSFKSLISALKEIAKNLEKNQIIVLESTLAPKTTQNLVIPTLEKISKLKINDDFSVAVAPERIRPNYIFKQLTTLPRIIGVSSPKIASKLKRIYTQITSGEVDLTDLKTAEVAKTVENTYRDVQIAFANEIALICEELGVNVWEVRRLVNKDPFKDIHKPGAGVGGHCIPKDPWLLAAAVEKSRIDLIKNARQINDNMPQHVLDLTMSALYGKKINPRLAKVAILGYSFVENSDDTRNSPTESLVKLLKKKKIKHEIYDPYVKGFEKGLEKVISGSNCLVLMVAHKDFEKIRLSILSNLMKTKIIVDGRNFFDRAEVESRGFLYKGIGNV